MREGVAVTALSVPEEDLPEVNGELGNRRVNDKWPLSYAVTNNTLIICRTIITCLSMYASTHTYQRLIPGSSTPFSSTYFFCFLLL